MPILTPSPGKNTAPQVISSTLDIYRDEFSRAYKLIKKVAKRKLKLSRALFEVPPQEHYQFVVVIDLITVGDD